MILFFDIDGTICKTTGTDYHLSTPIKWRIEEVNAAYDAGHMIVYWTSRGVGSGKDLRELTEKQLKEWGAKYHALRLDKPVYDYFIDDRAISANLWKKEDSDADKN